MNGVESFRRYSAAIAICWILSAASFANAFPTGKERTYNLRNVVLLGDHKNGPTIAYQVTANVRAGSVWGSDELKLLQFHLVEPRLHLPPKSTNGPSAAGFVAQKSLLESAVNRPFYAVWHLGAITKVYVHGKEDPSLINLKKAIISQFQYQLLDGEYDEEDVSGRCQVGYASASKVNYVKTKHRCDSDELVYHRRADKAIGVRIESSRQSAFKVTDDGTLVEVEATERHHVAVIANANAGSYIESTFALKFDGSISNIPSIAAAATVEEAIKTVKGLKKQTLQTDVVVPFRSRETASFKEAVKQFKGDLTDEMLGTHNAALALVKCVAAAKTTVKSEFLKVINAHSLKEQKAQFLDILAATQTRDAHEAALETLRITNSRDADLVERYLQGLAVGTRPHEWVINDLLRLSQLPFDEAKVLDTLFQTIAAMAFRFARLPNHSYATPTVVQVEESLVASLRKCQDNKCKELFIRSLHNLQSPTTVSLLFEYAQQGERTVGVAAMKALRDFPQATWSANPAHKRQFQQIFFQLTRRFDSSVRTLALDILLEQMPNADELNELLQFLRSTDKQFEVKKYLLQKLQMIADNCPRFRERFQRIVSSDAALNNYHILGQRGVTTAMSRTFSKLPSFNATLLSIQEIYGGVLKRGVVDMTVNAGEDKFSVFTLGLYAGGLSSFVSSGSSSGEQDDDPSSSEPATAGMEVSVQSAYFRPLQFFGSQSELMGHAWSGTAAEPTDAYTATTLLHDHQEIVRLQNGAGLGVEILGAVSIDLNGQVQFSLWNRNAHCQVDKNSGIALHGALSVETSFVNLRSEFTVTQEPRLTVLSDIDFSGDVKLCMQISQPETVLSHTIEKRTKVHGTQVVRTKKRSQNFRVAGFTQALNEKNNLMCNDILAGS